MPDDGQTTTRGTPLVFVTKDKALDGTPVTGSAVMIPVQSTAITHYGYNAEHQMLFLHFKGRKNTLHVMFDVPTEMWQAFQFAESKGKFYNTYLKDKYEVVPALVTEL
jgi:hypothetical protein